MGKAKRTAEQKAVLESARKLAPSKRPRGDDCAPVPTPRSPRARRFPPPSGAWIAPPPHKCTRNGLCSWYRCSGRRDGDWWKSRHSTSTSLTSPACREATAAALPPDVAHRCARARPHARTTCPPTALWGRLLRLLLLHPTSTPLRPRSSLRRRSGRCLPAAAPAPPNAHAHARPAFDPAAVAARR